MAEQSSNRRRDLLSSPIVVVLGYAVPLSALFATSFIDLPRLATAAVWALALSIMGLTCAANARRCGRVHCYFTAPFLFIAAILALLYGLEVPTFGAFGFERLGAALAAGTLLLWLGSESIFGRYFSRAADQP